MAKQKEWHYGFYDEVIRYDNYIIDEYRYCYILV